MSVGNRIYKKFKRIDPSLYMDFKDIPVANIGDASMKIACVDSHIRSMNHLRLIGQAYTVRVPEGDNLLVFYAIDNAQPGDIIVIDGDGYTQRALFGEILLTMAKKKKIGGFIINGAIRDYDAIEVSQIPVFATGISPNGPYRNGYGEVNVPVVIDGKVIQPGDIVIGDDEGIAVVVPHDVEAVLKAAKEIKQNEEELLKKIRENNESQLEWMYRKLQDIDCEIIDDVYE